MPSPLAHTAAGYALYHLMRRPAVADRRELLAVTGFAMLPDIDALAGLVGGDFARYHNNVTHSIGFALVAAAIGGNLACYRHQNCVRAATISFLAVGSHLMLDFWATRRGLLLFWPATTRRFVSPRRLFYGFRWGRGIWSRTHVWTMLTESFFAAAMIIGARALAQGGRP